MFANKRIDLELPVVTNKPNSFYYGWVIVAVSFFTLFLTVGMRFSFGVFYVAILQEYGWGRAETAGAFSVAMITHALFAVVTGNLIDRFGPRMLFPLGATFLAMGLAAASRITTIWHLYLFFGIVMAIGINTISYGPHMSLIPKWFIRKRGLASGLVVAGIGVGTMVIAPVIQFMIDTVGWRSAFLVLAGMILGVVVPMTALFQRRSPEEVGQFPDGVVPDSRITLAPQPEGPWKDTLFPNLPEQWTLRAALSSRAYWWVALMYFAAGFYTNMLVVHQAAHIVDAGYSPSFAAALVGLVGLLRSAGGVVGGSFSDRVGRSIGYTLGGCITFAGMVFFILVRDTSLSWLLYAFVILFGCGSGAMMPIIAASTADLFPGNFLGRIIGTLVVGFGFGGALGSYLAGYFYDKVGSYSISFLLVMLILCLGAFGMWMAAPRHRKILFPSKAG
jgi:MFS family permease